MAVCYFNYLCVTGSGDTDRGQQGCRQKDSGDMNRGAGGMQAEGQQGHRQRGRGTAGMQAEEQ